jgi:bifunctional DNA primase/polymerase-like protein
MIRCNEYCSVGRGVRAKRTPAGKVALVRHWQKVGLKGSSQLAMKFADADAFGFQCGKRSRITLIDVDSRDQRTVGEAVKLFGESPILWRTGSGNYAMPFRHNGEARRIRPLPGLPIDVLGGGYAVAPPSMGTKAHNEFLRGSLAPEEMDRTILRCTLGLRGADQYPNKK